MWRAPAADRRPTAGPTRRPPRPARPPAPRGCWGASASRGPRGSEEVTSFYEASVAIGKNRLEFVITRVTADRDAVVTEGVFRHAYSGEQLTSRGLAADGALEADGWYLVEYQALVVWPISDDGLIEGEDIYAGEQPRIVRALAPGECPHLGPRDRASAVTIP